MSKVRTSPYRQTPTPEGLKAIEKGTLDYFDTEMYANFNMEILKGVDSLISKIKIMQSAGNRVVSISTCFRISNG